MISSIGDRTEEAMLSVNKLEKNFGGAKVINGIDLNIRNGEVRCIIGPNGAGKSTLFKMITGELFPSSGSIVFRGEPVTRLPAFQRVNRGMSIKFQVPGVFGGLTVEQHLKLSANMAKMSVDMDINQALRRFNLEEDKYKQASKLPHGKKQWLEIAMAVQLQPKLLLLDEPAAGMSTDETYETGKMIHELNNRGLTLIVVEHDMEFIRQIASLVTVLHGGKVFAEGTAAEVLARNDVADIYLGKQ